MSSFVGGFIILISYFSKHEEVKHTVGFTYITVTKVWKIIKKFTGKSSIYEIYAIELVTYVFIINYDTHYHGKFVKKKTKGIHWMGCFIMIL